MKPPKIPTLSSNGSQAFTNLDKANLIAESLKTKFTEHPEDNRYSIKNEIDNFRIPKITADAPSITSDIVSFTIDEMKPGKSPGYDGICCKTLKLLDVNAIEYITRLFNSILKLQYFPKAWKSGIVAVLPKPGKPPHCPNSYRPITLLPTIGKVFERCLLEKLLQIEKRLSVLPDEQHGFRKGHSCSTQLARVTDAIIRKYNCGKHIIMTALDVEAAFDKVPHKYLLYKMSKFHFPDWVIVLLHSYFSDRAARVRIEDELSNPLPLEAGTPQGGLLSPFLYSIYTADIPTNPTNTMTALYADDTLQITTTDGPLLAEIDANYALHSLECFLKKWKIKVNGSKSNAIVISQKDKGCNPNLLISGSQINISRQLTYLGVQFDDQLLWDVHTKSMLGKAKRRTAMLISHIKDLPASSETKTLFYTTYIRPILTYGAAAWGGIPRSKMEHLLRFERKWIRIILGVPRYAKRSTYLGNAPFPLLDTMVRNELRRLLDSTYHHNNPTVRQLGTLPVTGGRRRHPLWRANGDGGSSHNT